MCSRRRQATKEHLTSKEFYTHEHKSPSVPSNSGTFDSTLKEHETCTAQCATAQTKPKERAEYGHRVSTLPLPNSAYFNHRIFTLGKQDYAIPSNNNRTRELSPGIGIPMEQRERHRYADISCTPNKTHYFSREVRRGIWPTRF